MTCYDNIGFNGSGIDPRPLLQPFSSGAPPGGLQIFRAWLRCSSSVSHQRFALNSTLNRSFMEGELQFEEGSVHLVFDLVEGSVPISRVFLFGTGVTLLLEMIAEVVNIPGLFVPLFLLFFGGGTVQSASSPV